MEIIMYIIIVPIWIIISVFVAKYAEDKGYSFAGFFLMSLFISPLIAVIILLILPVRKDLVEQGGILTGEFRKCPFCAETVKSEAIICKHCGRDLPLIENTTVFTTEIDYAEKKLKIKKSIDSGICPACDEELSGDVVRCLACGFEQ
jgi:hypothetical protein